MFSEHGTSTAPSKPARIPPLLLLAAGFGLGWLANSFSPREPTGREALPLRPPTQTAEQPTQAGRSHTPPSAKEQVAATGRVTVPYVRIVDGDTIKVIWQGEEVSVRMLRIDTPERGESGFKEAGDHLRSLIADSPTVELEFEEGRPNRDRFGRLLAYVWLDGRNLCIEQVRAGHTPFWTKYGEGKYAHEFRAAEAESK